MIQKKNMYCICPSQTKYEEDKDMLKKNSVQDNPPKLPRSKTVTKAEIDKMKEKTFNAAIEALGTDHIVCSGCKELLASMVGGRKGSKSPRKKSILELKTLTISKRKSSSNK